MEAPNMNRGLALDLEAQIIASEQQPSKPREGGQIFNLRSHIIYNNRNIPAAIDSRKR